MGLLGGMNRFVRRGQQVLIKPNMLSPQPPERAVTTHPSLVTAVAALVASEGATPSVGDSPGFYRFSRVAEVSRIGEAAAASGARLVPFDEEVELPTADGCLMKKLVVARAVANADAIVSLPKFKTHGLTHITGAVKNLFGCIPGLKKAEMHFRFPDNERFSQMLVDICLSIPVTLHILDAVAAMDGDGPGAGTPFPLGLIIAGADPVAVDSTACRAVGIDPLSIPMLRIGTERGLGNAAEERIQLIGDPLTPVPGFKSIVSGGEPGRLIPFPAFMLRRIKDWIVLKPGFLRDRCTLCGACVGICPAKPKALRVEAGRIVIDDRNCIRCYCCSEICPSRAIKLHRGPGAALLAKLLKISSWDSAA